MDERRLREEICEAGRRLYARGLAAACDSNLSARLAEREFLCTPTLVCKGFMRPDHLCTVDDAGNQLSGSLRRTSEILLHLAVYKARPDVQAVVHCHAPHALAFAITGQPVPRGVHPEVELFLGEVPTAPYETPGTQRFADSVVPFVRRVNAVVLANHGIVTFGSTVTRAGFNAEILDAYCRVLLLARALGPPVRLTDRQLHELAEARRRLGLDPPGAPVTG